MSYASIDAQAGAAPSYGKIQINLYYRFRVGGEVTHSTYNM
jgi:hypothetical protein